MRAAIATAYGPPEVVRIEERPKPVAGPGEILVRIHAASVSAGDWRLRSANVPAGFGAVIRLTFGFRALRQPILGTDFSGVVEVIGEGVTRFRPGDAVFGSAGFKMGCHADYRVFKETNSIAAKPENLGHVEAAALPFGGQTALGYLRDKAKLAAGERVLVIGASGAVGVAAVQIAHAFGAQVTGVTSSRNAALVRSLGANAVVEYDRTDLTALPDRFDVVVDAVGDRGYATLKHLLTDRGRYLAIVAGLPEMMRAAFVNMRGGPKLIVGDAGESREMIETLGGLAVDGRLKPVIDSVFPLEKIVEAHARVESRRKVGAVIVDMTT